MSNYGVFARYYDLLLKNGEYEVRSDYISDFFVANDINGGKLLDLACGTGEFTKHFLQKGYDVTGVDISADMLTVAKDKCPQADFICADMRNIDFGGAFDCCICCLDSFNHLNSISDWKDAFSGVAKSLKKGGMFVFDVNTPYKHNHVLADNSFIFDEDDFFLAWDNVKEENNKVSIFLDFFAFNGKNYDRYSESFKETAFATDEISALLKEDFEILGVYNELTKEPQNDKSERLYFVCKRK